MPGWMSIDQGERWHLRLCMVYDQEEGENEWVGKLKFITL